MKSTNNQEVIKLLSGNNEREPFQVYSAPISQVHKVVIDDEFREVYQFANLVDVLDQAQEGDCVQIKLSTVGGALHSIIPLISSMKNTEAYVHVHVESDVASAGTFLMMLADSCYINEYATIMFHSVQFGVGGHGGNVEAHVKHTMASSNELIRDMYTDFLTENELTLLLHGTEIYLTPDECHERFDKREELRAGQVEEMIAEKAAPKISGQQAEKFLEDAFDDDNSVNIFEKPDKKQRKPKIPKEL